MTSPAPARPRVLLADDHIPILESVSRLLAAAFDIVAVAGGGREALALSRQLRPDVIVLDINMPDLDGFQTLAELQRDGSQARVVFLSLLRDDEFIGAAITAGAHGYVLKSRIHLDLIGAIDLTLAGRLFVPSLTSLSKVPGSRHSLQIYADDTLHMDDVSRLTGATLLSGERVLVVATEATRNGVAQRLKAQQIDLTRLAQQGQYVVRDSVLTLSQAMRDGRPDRLRLSDVIHDFDRLRFADSNGHRLTIVSDMTASLWRRGDFEAALGLERIWNELTSALPFFTVCSYPIDCFQRSDVRHQLLSVCAEHGAVTSGVSRGFRATSPEVAL